MKLRLHSLIDVSNFVNDLFRVIQFMDGDQEGNCFKIITSNWLHPKEIFISNTKIWNILTSAVTYISLSLPQFIHLFIRINRYHEKNKNTRNKSAKQEKNIMQEDMVIVLKIYNILIHINTSTNSINWITVIQQTSDHRMQSQTLPLSHRSILHKGSAKLISHCKRVTT